jgi:dipeptidase
VKKGYDLVGYLPIDKTYRTILLAGNVESMTTGGMNEFGVTIAIEFIPMRQGLACDKGVVGPNSNHWTTSLIANGLLRAKTAREVIRIIGSMVEQYGFQYYRAPHAGVALPIADEKEVWLMEIFGPGADWTAVGAAPRGRPNPGQAQGPAPTGRPVGVWCAQRIPDGEVGCTANRSRIGKVDLANSDRFLASPNISPGPDTGILEKGPFVWSEVYSEPRQPGELLAGMAGVESGRPIAGRKATVIRNGPVPVFRQAGKAGQCRRRYEPHEGAAREPGSI